MSLRPVVRAVVRFCAVASIVFSGVTFGADHAEARRGGKVRTSQSHAKSQSHPDGGATRHDGTEATRKSTHNEDGSDASSGGAYRAGVRVRSREAARGTSETKSDAGDPTSGRGHALIPAAGSGSAANRDIDVPGCGTGLICTVCLAGCNGPVNSIVDYELHTPRPKPRQ